MEQLLTEITWWHWLVLALILFGAEMLTGTFDLLMASTRPFAVVRTNRRFISHVSLSTCL